MSTADYTHHADALVSWLRAQDLVVDSFASLFDGAVLLELLSRIDPSFFLFVHAETSTTSEDWVQRYNTLRRIHQLTLTYFRDVIGADAERMVPPDLQAIAQDASEKDLVDLVSLVLVLAVQSAQAQQHISTIQSLEQSTQAQLMQIIEHIVGQIGGPPASPELGKFPTSADLDFTREMLASLKAERAALQNAHADLSARHAKLQGDQERALSRIAQLEEDSIRGSEVVQLRSELARAESAVSDAEATIERLQVEAIDGSKRELTEKANEGTRLRDELDEYRHAQERLQKAENTLEKYKKKLEEVAPLRRSLKALEEQNTDLIDRHAKLEDEHRKLATTTQSGEKYKLQIAALETAKTDAMREIGDLRLELARATSLIEVANAETHSTRELYEDRIRELDVRPTAVRRVSEGMDDLSTDLDDSFAGTTTTDLKLQIRRLTRQLEDERSSKANPVHNPASELALVNADRVRIRYEQAYLQERRAHLQLTDQLEQIRSGSIGNESQTAAAVRLQLRDALEMRTKLEADLEAAQNISEVSKKSLHRAEADLELVGRDKVEALAILRDEVSKEKAELEVELADSRRALQDANDLNSMQLGQINSLLTEKVDMQGASLSQHGVLLAQERTLGDMKASGGATSAELRRLEDALTTKQIALQTAQTQLADAKDLIRKQDRRLKEVESKSRDVYDDSEQTLRSRLLVLKDELDRQKTLFQEMEERYQREHKLILSAWHNLGMQRMRDQLAANSHAGNPKAHEAAGWLGQQRAKTWIKI